MSMPIVEICMDAILLSLDHHHIRARTGADHPIRSRTCEFWAHFASVWHTSVTGSPPKPQAPRGLSPHARMHVRFVEMWNWALYIPTRTRERSSRAVCLAARPTGGEPATVRTFI